MTLLPISGDLDIYFHRSSQILLKPLESPTHSFLFIILFVNDPEVTWIFSQFIDEKVDPIPA